MKTEGAVALVPGANRVMLTSQAKPAANFRVIVKTVKVYR